MVLAKPPVWRHFNCCISDCSNAAAKRAARRWSDGRITAPGAEALSTDEALAQLERCATELDKLQRTHRRATLGAVANGTLTADAAIIRVDRLRSLQTLAWHAWRSTFHLVGRDG